MTNRRNDPKIDEEKKEESSDSMQCTPFITEEKQQQKNATTAKSSVPARRESSAPRARRNIFVGLFLLLAHLALFALFVPYLAAICLHEIAEDYLHPQLKLMRWKADGRDFDELTYYHRKCDASDISASSVEDLLISPNMTTEEATQHMLTHGASMYPDLLTPGTAAALREFIDKENRVQEGFHVIQNENRYSWGIDMNMHPAFQTYWKELASNRQLVNVLESMVGPDPAIIEFTAITSAYGAVDQHDHQDVVPPGSGAKFARSFIPSYSLFIPLQDTTYDMGATHVCPGTHLCSEGCEESCPPKNLAMSGRHGVWKTGWGALVNQQTTHKGMGHFCEGCPDRIVLIATFAPRPQTKRKLETRMIGQGGSYSLKWNHWGHTFSDFVNAESRMTEAQKYLRSMGLLKGNGWTFVAQASMRISNFEYGYNDAEDFIEDGGFSFLPKSWQALDEEQEDSEDNLWYTFMFETLQKVEDKLEELNKKVVGGFFVFLLVLDLLQRKSENHRSFLVGGIKSLLISHGVAYFAFSLALQALIDSNWAKDIESGKAFRLRTPKDNVDIAPMTIPTKDDILITKLYETDMLARYSDVLNVAHPGNRVWKNLVQEMSAGYPNLSESLQLDLCRSMVGWMQTHRRFLTQNVYRQWERIEEKSKLVNICHREVISESDELTRVMLRQVDILKDDAQNGRWRDMAIHTKFMPKNLDTWEERFLPTITSTKKEMSHSSNSLLHLSYRSSVQAPSTVRRSQTNRRPLPPTEEPREPFSGAWLEVGEVVEAKFRCRGKDWYQGTIIDAVSNEGTYTLEYADGDVDEGLQFFCIRRPIPYEIGEAVGFRTEAGGEWASGTIVEIVDKEIVKVKESSSGHVFDDVSVSLLSRLTRISRSSNLEGRRVLVRYGGGDEYFPGVIDEDHEDGTYDIQYDDGDFQEGVTIEDIELQ